MNDDQATIFADIMDAGETISERVFTANRIGIFNKSALAKDMGKETIKDILLNFSGELGENVVQEAVMEPFGQSVENLVTGKPVFEGYDEELLKRSIEAGIDGGLTELIMGGAYAGVPSCANVYNKIKNNQNVTTEDISTMMEELNEKGKDYGIDTTETMKRNVENSLKLQEATNNNQIPGQLELVSQATGEGFKNAVQQIQQGTPTEQAVQDNLAEPKQMIPVANQQQEVYQEANNDTGIQRITTAPFFERALTKENMEQTLREVDETYKGAVNKIAGWFGIAPENTTTNIGGFTFQEGSKAGQVTTELSYTFDLGNVDSKTSDLIASLVGDLALEQQEAVISANYLDTTSNDADAIQIEIPVKSTDGIADVLHKVGINDFTIDTTNGKIILLDFSDRIEQGTKNNISNLLGELGGEINGEINWQKISSRYLDTGTRRGMYEQWLKETSRTEQNRQLYDSVTEALNRVNQRLNQTENAQNEGSFNLPENQEVPQAQELEQEPMNDANMDNLLQEVDKQVAPVQPEAQQKVEQQKELPKKKKGKYQSVIESSTNTRIVDKRNKAPLKKTLEAVKKIGEDFYQGAVNHRYYTDKLAKKTGNESLKWKGDKSLSSGATANFVIDRKQTNYNNTKVVGDSVNGIIDRAKKDKVYEPLNDYLYLKNHADRKIQNKGYLGLSVEEANQKADDLLKRYPKIKEYAKEIHDFCHNELQVLVDSGVISEKWANAWEKTYPNYVPVFSQLSGKIEDNIESDTVTGGRGVKKAKGGTYDIAPIDIALANYTTRIRRAVGTNNFIKELAKTIEMDNNQTQEGLDNYEIIEPESLFEETNAPVQEIDGKYQGIYFENGVAHPFELTKDLYKSAKEISTDTLMDRIGKTIGLQKFTELQRNLQTTYNLPFGAVNYLKDAQAGLYNSKNPLNYEKNVPLAWKELVTNNNKTKNYKAGDTLSTLDTFLANGGLMASYFNSEEGTISNSKGIRGKIANANASIEMSHRLAEYMSTMELREKSLRKQLEADGLSKKEIDSIIEEQRADFIDEAVYNASEITTNFKRGGRWVKTLNRNGFNYLNASVQGFDRFVRTATQNRTVGEWAGFISKVALLGIAPALINDWILGDDDDYKKLRDNDKDLYYLIKIGDGKFIRIPKGRELSVFGTWARRTKEAISGKGLEAYKGMGETVSNQVAPNNPVTNNVFAPLIQAVNNETWWGGEIVKGQMKNKPASEQYDEYTDDFSKFLGSKLNMSPKKINYAINQYTGGIGDMILPSITTATKGVNPVTNVFKDKFTVDSVLKNRLSTDFYDLIEKQESRAKMTNASDEDKLKNKYLQMMKKELYPFYDEKDKILNDESLSYEEKQAKVREVQKEINQWMEETMQKYDKVEKVDEDISKIGDEFYVKNKGGKYAGEYRELYDNEVEEMNNLYKAGVSEKDYIRFKQDNTYYDDEGKAHQKKSIDKINYMLNDMDLSEKQLKAMYTETVGNEDEIFKKYKGSTRSYLRFKSDSDKQKNKRTSEEGATVSQADKMNALIKGKYDNKERQLLYDTFASDKDTVYKALKKSDINMKEYLKFKQADLKADTADDGTVKGKTISGSKKAKVINYINSMNITYEQKLLLMGDQYTLSNQERTKLANYINGLNMSKKDKMDLYSKMSGFTVYKDGRVTW